MRRAKAPRNRAPLRAALLVLLGMAGCATPGPRTFRFASNLEPADSRTCALDVLRRRGFEVVQASGEEGAVVAVRRPVRTADGPGEWWRVEVSVAPGPDGSSLVTSVVAASARESGPFTALPERLVEVGSEITARCMWERPSGDPGSSGSAGRNPQPSYVDDAGGRPGPPDVAPYRIPVSKWRVTEAQTPFWTVTSCSPPRGKGSPPSPTTR